MWVAVFSWAYVGGSDKVGLFGGSEKLAYFVVGLSWIYLGSSDRVGLCVGSDKLGLFGGRVILGLCGGQ